MNTWINKSSIMWTKEKCSSAFIVALEYMLYRLTGSVSLISREGLNVQAAVSGGGLAFSTRCVLFHLSLCSWHSNDTLFNPREWCVIFTKVCQIFCTPPCIINSDLPFLNMDATIRSYCAVPLNMTHPTTHPMWVPQVTEPSTLSKSKSHK